MNFRKDINGLRALAVIAVVLFHFNSSWMPGGFAGVDVFFVISGFLMTGIIFRGMEQDNFSVLNFYVARANRIIPALALLCLVLLVFGWFYLTPFAYRELGKHAASSVGFLSNFIYWKEAGYFDAASHEKWLLHTWSLSVEWQFYIIYPLVLIALRKFLSINTLKLLLIVGTILGFIFSVVITYKLPNAAYYLFPTRAWEMMIGGVAYLYPFTLQESRKKLVEWTGLILVIASYFLISAENLWPGYLAIFPVLGSFLIIQAQRNESIFTGNIVFQKLGAWSYSIYLWHWPFVVAIYTFSLPSQYIYIGMVLSVLLGFLSYKYIERIKFSRSFPSILSYLKCKPIYIAAPIFLISIIIIATNGAKTRFVDREPYVKEQMKNIIFPSRATGYCFFNDTDPGYPDKDLGTSCLLTNTGDKKILLFGSSYAGMYEPFWKEFAKDNNYLLQSITTSWCAPYLNDDFPKTQLNTEQHTQCLYNRRYVSENIEDFDAIVLAGLWSVRYQSGSLHYIKPTIDLALSKGVKVILMASPVAYASNPIARMESSLWSEKAYKHQKSNDTFNQEANDYVHNIADEKGVFFVKRDTIFDEKDFYLKNDLEFPYSLDGGHISQEGSLYAYKFFKGNKYDANVINYIENKN